MNDRVFVDANILVYSRDMSEGEKQRIAATTLRELWTNRTGQTSIQVCNEYFVTVTTKLVPGISEEDAWDDVKALFAWNPVPIDVRCLKKSREIQARYRISWWDSLIIAAAHIAGCAAVLSEDLNSDQVYDGIQVSNPFVGYDGSDTSGEVNFTETTDA